MVRSFSRGVRKQLSDRGDLWIDGRRSQISNEARCRHRVALLEENPLMLRRMSDSPDAINLCDNALRQEKKGNDQALAHNDFFNWNTLAFTWLLGKQRSGPAILHKR